MFISRQLFNRCNPNEVIISHNEEFVNALCQSRTYLRIYTRLIAMLGPEIWNISEGRMTHKGKAAVVEEAFADFKSPRGSGSNTPVRSRVQTPIVSAAGTPAASGTEDKGNPAVPVLKKKKLTRNQMKVQEERRRQRKLDWLQYGGSKPEETDED
jgi:elongation factor 3